MSVKSILEHFGNREQMPLGDEGLARDVVNRLRRHAVMHRTLFMTYFIALILVGGFGVVGIAWFLNQPEDIAVVGSAMGLSIGGVMELARRSIREWNSSSLLILLIEDAKESEVSVLIDKLIAKM